MAAGTQLLHPLDNRSHIHDLVTDDYDVTDRSCCCLSSIAQEEPLVLHLFGDMAPPAARDISEVTRTLNRRFYSHAETAGL